jgi:hypothetical protein
MTDKKKSAPSMKLAAATQKSTKSELEELLKNAQQTAEGEAADDDEAEGDDDDSAPAKKKKKH